MAAANALDLFEERLPHHPYCSDDLTGGLVIRAKKSALKRSLIQFNPPAMVGWLVFDIDRVGAANAWQDADLLPPAWVAINPANGHCHISYGIQNPVCRSENGRIKPLRYLAAIEAAYCVALSADRRYSGLITKNPLHADWRVYRPVIADGAGIYELAELAEYVDLTGVGEIDDNDAYGLGRNCALFDELRKWSYTAITDYWQPGGQSKWLAAVQNRAENLNEFHPALPISEIISTAKSIARWTWMTITPVGRRELIERTHTSLIQAERGRKSGVVRAAKSRGFSREIKKLRADGISQQKIANQLGITQGRVSQILKVINEPISDNSPRRGGRN
jgi:hypothetical protein